MLLTTLRLSRGAPVSLGVLGDSSRIPHISSSIEHQVFRGRVCQIWSRGTAPSMTGHSCLCSSSAVTCFESLRQRDAFNDLPAYMCMYTEFHTRMYNLPVWLHLAVHTTHMQEGIVTCPSVPSESPGARKTHRDYHKALITEPQGKDKRQRPREALTWVSRVISGLGCASCGESGEDTHKW